MEIKKTTDTADEMITVTYIGGDPLDYDKKRYRSGNPITMKKTIFEDLRSQGIKFSDKIESEKHL